VRRLRWSSSKARRSGVASCAIRRRALPLEMADELAKIHSIEPLDFLPRGDSIARFYDELDSVGEPHPAIEYGLAWVRERLAPSRDATFVHGDFRLGNLAVGDHLVAVLDWEFAHVGDPVEDVAWPLVRAWALRRGRAPARRCRRRRAVPRALHRAHRSRHHARGARRLGSVRQRQVGDRLPHPVAASSQRAGSQRRVRRARTHDRRDGVRAARPDRAAA
jgi:aminoglycoside phosphotransferase (APT) family kinase protein